MNLTKEKIIKMLENKEQVIYKNLPDKFREDVDIYSLVSKTNKICFKYALGDDILRNEDFIKKAINGSYYNYDYIPEDLKNNKELNLKLIRINHSVYKKMNAKMQGKEDIFLEAMHSLSVEEITMYVRYYFTDSKRILINMLENNIRLGVSIFSDKLKSDKELLKQIFPLRPQEIVYFKKEVREQKDILMLWLKNNIENVVYFDYKDEYLPFYKQACKKEMHIFSYLPEEVRGHKDFVLDLLTDKDNIKYQRAHTIIKGMNPNLKFDRDIFLTLAKIKDNNFDLLLPEALYDDIEILKEFLKNNERVTSKKSFKVALHKYREIALLLLEKDDLDYRLLPKKLQNSVSFNSEILKKNDAYFSMAPDKIKSNKNFIRKYANFDKENFRHVPNECKLDLIFMTELLNNNIELFDIMPRKIRLNRDVLDNFRCYINTNKNKLKEEFTELQRMNRQDELHYVLKENDEQIKRRAKI